MVNVSYVSNFPKSAKATTMVSVALVHTDPLVFDYSDSWDTFKTSPTPQTNTAPIFNGWPEEQIWLTVVFVVRTMDTQT